MRTGTEKIMRYSIIFLILMGAIVTSPIWITIIILWAGYSIIIEVTQEYRCMRCGTWIPKSKRNPGEIVHWCSKDCYLDR